LTNQTTPLVNFMIVGTHKGGTTALNHFLDKHAEIHMAPIKETHFFDQENLFGNGQPDYSAYHSFFEPERKPAVKMIGEANPCYMFLPRVAPRLKEYNPALKLIVMLRHPVERAYSHYNMIVRMEKEYLPFYNALRVEEIRLGAVAQNYIFTGPTTIYSYKSRGFYAGQIKNLLNYFPREQILFLRNEELLKQHSETLQKIFDFLGVPNDPSIGPEKIFEGANPPLEGHIRAELLKLYEADITELEQLLGWDLTAWRH